MKLDLNIIHDSVKAGLAEDIGEGDITSNLTVAKSALGDMVFNAREPMVVCGLPVVEEVIRQVDASMRVDAYVEEGEYVTENTPLMRVRGSARSILAFERVALNFLQYMSAIATLSYKYVQAVQGTRAVVLDTRKTVPTLRIFAKYAVAIGGAQNHRFGLSDGILIKDNHIHIAGGIIQAVTAAQQGDNKGLLIQIECDTLEQVKEAIGCGVDSILLDNMSCDQLSQAVKMVGENGPKLEASGGVTLNTVGKIAQTGVDFISVGALTHSAGNMDIGLDSMV